MFTVLNYYYYYYYYYYYNHNYKNYPDFSLNRII